MERIVVYKDRVRYEYPYSDIVYVMAKCGDTQYLIGDELYRNELSLKKVEEIIDKRIFLHVNRECIVNISKVRYTKGDTNVYIGETPINISRRRKAFELAYMEYEQTLKLIDSMQIFA